MQFGPRELVDAMLCEPNPIPTPYWTRNGTGYGAIRDTSGHVMELYAHVGSGEGVPEEVQIQAQIWVQNGVQNGVTNK